MKSKLLWKISVATTTEAEDAVAQMLGQHFHCSPISYVDIEKQTTTVSIYLDKHLPRNALQILGERLSQIKTLGLNTGAAKISIKRLRQENWAESWKRHFQPLHFGNLLVKPGWNKQRPHKNQAVVILDPGLSFGTGHHPTTSFCLRNIMRLSKGRGRSTQSHPCQSFLDIGTGSGILAIAAVKLGFQPVRAIDFDPRAVQICRANAVVNAVFNQMKIARADVANLSLHPQRQFDLVAANLTSDLLVAGRRRIVAQLKAGGALILAGILSSEFSMVKQAFRKSGLRVVSARTEKNWRSGLFRFIKNY